MKFRGVEIGPVVDTTVVAYSDDQLCAEWREVRKDKSWHGLFSASDHQKALMERVWAGLVTLVTRRHSDGSLVYYARIPATPTRPFRMLGE